MKRILFACFALMGIMLCACYDAPSKNETATTSPAARASASSPPLAQTSSITQPVQSVPPKQPAQNVEAAQSVRNTPTASTSQNTTSTQARQNSAQTETKKSSIPTKASPTPTPIPSRKEIELEIRVLRLEIDTLMKDIEENEKRYKTLADKVARKTATEEEAAEKGRLEYRLERQRGELGTKQKDLDTKKALLVRLTTTPSASRPKANKTK